jgi:hypothetical protein
MASIANWWVLSAGGETKAEALQQPEKAFAAAKTEKANARLKTKVHAMAWFRQ